MKKLFFITMLLILTIWSHATTYYIATTGNNGNSGTSTGSPWATMTYAASSSSPVAAGDTVYVKAGNYGNENIVFQTSGTYSRPISFLGYQTTPGDAPAICTDKADPYATLVTTDMPTYTGSSRGSGAICMDMELVEHVFVKNFQMTAYSYGVIGGGATVKKDVHLYNICAFSIGSTTASYSGLGIRFGSMSTKFANTCSFQKCLVSNACAEGFDIAGDYNYVKDCEVWCNEDASNARTDYYIIVTGSYNEINGCHIERLAGLSSTGFHGITLKSNAEQVVDAGLPYTPINPTHNRVINCSAVNMAESFVVRHRGVQYNHFEGCTAYGTHTGAVGSGTGEGYGIIIRDGASYNTFTRCWIQDCATGIKFQDTVEDGDTGGSPPGHPGHGNIVSQSVFVNCYSGIDFSNTGISATKDCGDNLISNNTFYRPRYFIRASKSCDSIKFEGVIVYGCASTNPNTGGVTEGFIYDNGYGSDILAAGTQSYFKDCAFYSIQTGMPAGFTAAAVGSVTVDPTFVDKDNYDFRLQASSPCIDACDHVAAETVKTAPYCHLAHIDPLLGFLCSNKYHLRNKPHVWRDYVGTLCPVGTYADMGAYEYKP